MEIFGKDLARDVPLVAEVGVNHEGSPEKALELIGLAADAGADAVKFQTYTPERYASASDPERLDRVTRFSLDPGIWAELSAEARRCGVGFFSTPVTEDAVALLDPHCEVFKIASGDITFEPVIRSAVSTGKPVIISTGAADVAEIGQALAWCRDEKGDDDLTHSVILMHCVALYPTPVDHANLRSIPFLTETFGLPTGYSNHVIEPEAVIAAVALGANVVEVHFTDQRSGREFRDHGLSADAVILASLSASIGNVRSALGDYEKPVTASELDVRPFLRKGLVASRDLAPGAVLAEDDIMYARPATGFASDRRAEILGKVLSAPVARGEQFRPEIIAGD